MAEESKPITVFSLTDGYYQFCKMPFGLMNAVVTFNRTMRKLLADVKDTEAYVDDVIEHKVTWDAHIANLRVLFGKIREAGLTIRSSKCMIGFRRVDVLAHAMENGTITMETDKLEKIQDVEPPTTKKQVGAFIGLPGYYRKFIPNFAEIAIPLTDLTKKGQPTKVTWRPEQQHAFNVLWNLLNRAPILCLPDFNCLFIVQADASETGVGAAWL